GRQISEINAFVYDHDQQPSDQESEGENDNYCSWEPDLKSFIDESEISAAQAVEEFEQCMWKPDLKSFIDDSEISAAPAIEEFEQCMWKPDLKSFIDDSEISAAPAVEEFEQCMWKPDLKSFIDESEISAAPAVEEFERCMWKPDLNDGDRDHQRSSINESEISEEAEEFEGCSWKPNLSDVSYGTGAVEMSLFLWELEPNLSFKDDQKKMEAANQKPSPEAPKIEPIRRSKQEIRKSKGSHLLASFGTCFTGREYLAAVRVAASPA
ncbi:hypothetical protein LINGRAHAP2_LOCUS36110, partial [Linum grandiflorum]